LSRVVHAKSSKMAITITARKVLKGEVKSIDDGVADSGVK
jgi:molybdopterin-binding protein